MNSASSAKKGLNIYPVAHCLDDLFLKELGMIYAPIRICATGNRPCSWALKVSRPVFCVITLTVSKSVI